MNYKNTNYISWDEYFMGIVYLAAKRSKDPNTQVGACIVDNNNKILSIGYNGMPINCSDDIFPWSKTNKDEYNNKYLYVVHAEINAIINNQNKSLKGSKLYVSHFPCNECTKVIIQSGIKEIIYGIDKYKESASIKASKRMLDAANIKYRQYEFKNKIINIRV